MTEVTKLIINQSIEL